MPCCLRCLAASGGRSTRVPLALAAPTRACASAQEVLEDPRFKFEAKVVEWVSVTAGGGWSVSERKKWRMVQRDGGVSFRSSPREVKNHIAVHLRSMEARQ